MLWSETMNEEAGFLEAIAANPGDETHVLVFADWLEERGDPRGQWIRRSTLRQWMGPKFENPVPALLAQLAKGRGVMAVRRAARYIGEPIVAGLAELLKHAEWYVRKQAAVCLGHIGPKAKAAIPALLAAMKDEHSAVRKAAAAAVTDIGADESAGTETLRDALNDTHHRVRQEAAKILGAMGAKADVLGELAKRLESKTPKERIAAVEALGQLQTTAVIEHLGKVLTTDQEPDVRNSAARQLAQYARPGQSAMVEFLRQALSDRSPTVRRSVLGVLAQLTDARNLAPDVIRNLSHKSGEVRSAAATALGRIAKDDPDAASALLQVTADPELEVARSAVDSLNRWTKLPAEAAEPLMALLTRFRTDDYRRQAVLATFGLLTSPPVRVISTLRERVRTEDRLTATALQALGQLGPSASSALPDMLAYIRRADYLGTAATLALVRIGGEGHSWVAQLLTSREESIRNRTVYTLQSAGSAALPLLPTLLQRLHSPKNESQQSIIISAISHIGPEGTAAIPDLLKLAVPNKTPYIATSAIRALGVYGAAMVPHVPALARLATSENQAIHQVLAQLFTKLAEYTHDVLEPLRELIRISTQRRSGKVNFAGGWTQRHTLLAVVEGLTTLGADSAAAVPELAALLETDWSEDHKHVVAALVATKSPLALPALRRALEGKDETARARAAEGLGKLGDSSKETLSVLLRAIEDRVARVRREAIDAFGRLKPNTREVLAALQAATTDTDTAVRARAVIVLKKLEPKPNNAKKKKTP
jgi:uncharacterized protein (TIGR02996 family)